MKFLVFNLVVAAALIYLVADQDNGLDVSLPSIGDVTAAAEKTLDRVTPPAPPVPAQVDAPVIADEDLQTRMALAKPQPKPEVAEAPPVPPADAPLAPTPVVEVATREAHVITAPPPDGDPAIARRRAEVLGEGPVGDLDLAQPTTDRRRQLLDLAEEMEFLAAEFAVQ